MRVEKQIALLLSGAILAGSLAGCSRTIIEHQFNTDIITNTETITDIIKVPTFEIFSDLEELFTTHGKAFKVTIDGVSDIYLEGAFAALIFDKDFRPLVGQPIKAESFFSSKKYTIVVDICEDGIDYGIEVLSSQETRLYSALKTYESEHSDMWDEVSETVTLQVTMSHLKEDGEIKTAVITTLYNR